MTTKKTRFFSIVLLLVIPANVLAFSDLPDGHKYSFPLTYLSGEGIIEGYSDGTVKPDNTINRAELLKILVKGLTESDMEFEGYGDCFPDVKTGWYAQYVCYALEKQWISGYPDGTFKPDQTINKAEALKIILNAFEIPDAPTQTIPFSDVDADGWYVPFIQAALNKNLLEESGQNKFYPGNARTRGEIAELISRIMQIQYMNDPAYSDLIKAEFQTFLLINKLRSENGVTAGLILNPYLTKVAREHSKDMAEVIGDMSHEGSDGRQSYDRIRESGLEFDGRTGENVGRGTIGTYRSMYQAILDVHNNVFMIEPDGTCNHRTTILSTCLPFSEVGIGVYVKNSTLYFTEDFISRN
ncbi:MAG TPA: S-layer homology domain-containing protein [Candidatus Gracilibacteria bacterium]|nr:S-layer homology domain-containing protein [Candidatus Gracilibacteria bacterium]